ncbi:MAG: discoidin domain-containing protein [Bacteroidaceae bacterium]|nr:discoidin domain-containing protein [Bacteroidaceae bacterium]
MKTKALLWSACLAALLTACNGNSGNMASQNGEYNLGIGLYPGNPEENFAPQLVEDDTYRNIALLHKAYHSSSYDYNLTGQLVTDGIIDTETPASISLSTAEGRMPKNEQEYLFDTNYYTRKTFKGKDLTLQLDFEHWSLPANRLWLNGWMVTEGEDKRYEMKVYASVHGSQWELLKEEKGVMPRGWIDHYIDFEEKGYQHYRIELSGEAAREWQLASWDFFRGEELLNVLPSAHFTSTWRSATNGEEWVYVDFGSEARFDEVTLHWINRASAGALQVSDDAKTWKDIATLSEADNYKVSGKGRYLRVLLTQSANGQPYELSELQVMGRGAVSPQPHQALNATDKGLALSGGDWKLQRASLVDATGEQLSQTGYDASSWLPATVPGTVLTSYVNAGAIPEPNFADNQLIISESYFLSDFWYRNEFTANKTSERAFLKFDGINWKAKVWLNGSYLGEIDGGFLRGNFDVTEVLKQGTNVLAVQVIKNAHPGAVKEQTAWSSEANGGILGADNATFHASIGWDWIPTIRGRNMGIWDDVYLTYTGAVTLKDPFVRSELPLPETNSAKVFVEVEVENHADQPVNGTLKGKLGDISFEQALTLAAKEKQIVKLNPENTPQLLMQNPRLWWPNGYGEQYLYDVALSFDIDGQTSDETNFKTGIRQMTFEEEEYASSGVPDRTGKVVKTDKRLNLYVNGRRFVGFGGNWGFSESNLNYRGREYDIAVKHHQMMNFTMIRNWVGQIGDKEFYEACDKYGIMIWQDFWLANPADGPDPYYEDLFKENATDYLLRARNHPSVAIYVGRNEGNPPASLDGFLRTLVAENHPGMHYISHSAAGVVSGEGPYRALPIENYFHLYGHDKFHSERGMPNVMSYESMLQAFGAEHMEPVNTIDTPNNIYGMHDYTLGGQGISSAQSAFSFNEMIERAFGKPKDAKQFSEWAQWINYNGYRAMFEGRSEYRRGLLLWMSHPAWPSMTWQTYDYYFDPTAAYYGCMKACEALHILWNPLQDNVQVVNYHAGNQQGLQAKAQVLDQNGKVHWEKEVVINVAEDETVSCFPLEYPESLTDTYFIKLTLLKDGKPVSDNFYWKGKENGNYKSLLQLPKTKLAESTQLSQENGEWTISCTLKNDTEVPALMVRLNTIGDKSGERILPAFYTDNYFFLMPGEEKTVSITLSQRDTRGERPVLKVEGFNL